MTACFGRARSTSSSDATSGRNVTRFVAAARFLFVLRFRIGVSKGVSVKRPFARASSSIMRSTDTRVSIVLGRFAQSFPMSEFC